MQSKIARITSFSETLKIFKTTLSIKLSNIARTDLGSVTSDAYNIIGKQNDFSNSTQTIKNLVLLQYKALKVPQNRILGVHKNTQTSCQL